MTDLITLQEYNRRWELIMEAYRTGYLNRREASEAIGELTSQRIWHHPRHPDESKREKSNG